MQCYIKVHRLLGFFEAEEIYDIAATITFDTVDESSNNRP